MTQTADGTALQPQVSTRTRVGVLATATAIGSIGLAAGGIAGPLLATELTGSAASAGLPVGIHVSGSAVGAILISRVSGRAGRAAGLVLGYVLGAVGAVIVAVAAVVASFGLVLVGSAVFGIGNASVFLARYAAAEIGGVTAGGRALGTVLFGAAAGAVVSPNLLSGSGHLAAGVGLPRLTGLYLVAVPSFVVAALLLLVLTRSPARMVVPDRGELLPARRGVELQAYRPRVAVLVLAATNLVMVAVMAIAPVHLTAHGHGLDLVGAIVSVHVLCMFVPSLLSGWLVDRAGPAVLATGAALVLAASGIVGAAADPHSSIALMAALGLLGLGWNAGMVAGSAMLTASVPPDVRLRAEGVGEVAMGLAAGGGAPVAGLVVAAGGFPALAVAGSAVALLVSTPLAAQLVRRRQ